MKFTDGAWMMREGVSAHHAAEVFEVDSEGHEWRIVAPCQPIRHRGDTLGGPVLTLRVSSPAPGVIRVRSVHFEGALDRGPRFEVAADPLPMESTITSDEITLSSGPLAIRVPRKEGFRMEFRAEGRVLTQSPARGHGLAEVRGDGKFRVQQLTLGVGELVYGLGERFGPFIKNGQSIEMWNRDGGACTDQAYKNIPFYLTNRGYGVFVNDPGPVSFEVGTEHAARVQFSVPGESIDFFVIYGPTPKEILERYTALTGRPARVPKWSFGLWLTTSFTTSYDEGTVNEFIQGMADRDLPLAVFHYDCFWMRGMHWCDFEWDPAVFPEPEAMLTRLHDRGLKVCVWINPYIAQASRLFAEAAREGYLLKRPNGDVWQWDLWQPGMGIVDFTNPQAKRWYQSHLARIIDMGVDALKTDFGERIPTDVVYADGSDPVRMHNQYAQLYNQAVYEVLEERKGEAVLFARSATVGGQKYPVHWGGDSWSSFEDMANSLRAGLSLGLGGFGYWSHDIGGFEGTPDPALYKRWVAFGMLSSHSRLHGSTSYRTPWLVDEESVDVLREFTKLKHRLAPYLWMVAEEAVRTGVPIMRAMHLEFPNDPGCASLDRQYMLGPDLLVAPVMSASGEVLYYVPEGKWTNVINGEVVEGPGWRRETHGFLSLPLLARPGSRIAWGTRDDRFDYDYDREFEIRSYPSM